MPIASAGISAGGSIISGILGANAASTAAQEQENSQQQAIQSNNNAKEASLATLGNVYSTDQSTLAPYLAAGGTAVSQLSAGTAPGGVFNSTPTGQQVLDQDPGYQFRLDQGQQALQRAEAAGGGVGSGGALKAGIDYGQDYASNEYANASQRFMQNREENYSNLAGIASLGQNATGQLVNAGTNFGNQSSGVIQNTGAADANALTNIGNAQASGTIGSASAIGGALSGIAQSADALPFNSSGYGGGPDVNTPTWNPVTGQEVYPNR